MALIEDFEKLAKDFLDTKDKNSEDNNCEAIVVSLDNHDNADYTVEIDGIEILSEEDLPLGGIMPPPQPEETHGFILDGDCTIDTDSIIIDDDFPLDGDMPIDGMIDNPDDFPPESTDPSDLLA